MKCGIRVGLVFVCLAVLASSTARAEPPWYGTIFIAPDTITESDPTTFSGMTYAGQGMRYMYDRRVESTVYVNAYLFNATFHDGLAAEVRINPEFGSVANAQIEAEKYSIAIGRLPNALREDVAHVAIHKGVEKFGGGGGGILIHTGYAEQVYIPDGILEETLAHEAAHTSLDADHRNSAGWLAAQTADPEFISEYARDYPTREDIAESFVPYMAVRYRSDRISESIYDTITTTIPNRLDYFDAQNFNMYPMDIPQGYTWIGPTSGTADWNDADNWISADGDYPDSPDAIVNLKPNNTGSLTIDLNEAVTIGTLKTGDSGGDMFATTLAPGSGGSLTFDVTADNAQWTHEPGGNATFDIAAEVLLDDSIDIYNDQGNYDGRQLVSGPISAASAGTKTILWNGRTDPSGGGQPYIRLEGAITDGAGEVAVTCQSTSTSSGPGLYLDNNGNTYTGQTQNISAGSSDLIVSQPNSLGSPTVGTTVAGGNGNAVLFLRASVSDEPLTISGQGWAGGALWNDRNPVTYGGPITLADDARIGAGGWNGSAADLTLDVPSGNAVEGNFNLTFNPVWGPVTVNDPIAIGAGSLTKQGANTLTLNAVNDYKGDTIIDAGTLSMTVPYLQDASTVAIAAGAVMDLNFSGSDRIGGLTLGGAPVSPGTYSAATDPTYFTGSGELLVVEPILHWDGGNGSWFSATQWDGGAAFANADMIINAETDVDGTTPIGPSGVIVDSDFVSGGDGPAKSVTIGTIGDTYRNYVGVLVEEDVTLDVTGATTIEQFGVVVIDAGGVLDTGSFEAKSTAKVLSYLKGSSGGCGTVNTGELTIAGANSFRVHWFTALGDDATSMFGGTYTLAQYTGTSLADFGNIPNTGSNIGAAYIKDTRYAVDVNGDGSLYALEVELHAQGIGDTDLDGTVGPADLADFGLGWSPNATDKLWIHGDFDFNGNVDPADLAAFGLAWAPNGIQFPADTGIDVVPEPGTVAMLLIGLAGLLLYRKRR